MPSDCGRIRLGRIVADPGQKTSSTMSCSTLDLSSSPSFQAIFSDDVRKLQDIFKRSGHEIRYVMGSPTKYYFFHKYLLLGFSSQAGRRPSSRHPRREGAERPGLRHHGHARGIFEFKLIIFIKNLYILETNACVIRIQEMRSLFASEGVRCINEGGETHGTVTARIGQSNFEVKEEEENHHISCQNSFKIHFEHR